MSNIRESYIPFRRTDIVNLCLEEGKLKAKDVQLFKEFCDILTAFFHFRFHNTLESIKDNYTVFNPNSDVKTLQEPSLQEYEKMEAKVLKGFKYVLKRANFFTFYGDELIFLQRIDLYE